MADPGGDVVSSLVPADRDGLHREIERALASLPGVIWARIRSEEGPRPRLRLGLRAGQERAPVADAVAATLQERFSIAIDPSEVRVVDPSGPAWSVPAAALVSAGRTTPLVGRRASITHLDIAQSGPDVHVSIGLARDERRAEGRAVAGPAATPLLLAVGQATAAALTRLTVRAVDLEIVEVIAEPASEPDRVIVIVRLGIGESEERLIGASLIRGDPERAVVRATLDAVNRRVEPLLRDDPPQRPTSGVAGAGSSGS